jgi:hypothetical protein
MWWAWAASRQNHRECRKMAATTTKAPQPMLPSVADDPRWAHIVAPDKTANGRLWCSVTTTGDYCRPSCPSRLANPKNVQLHESLEGAKATGFQPCRRCNPDGSSRSLASAPPIRWQWPFLATASYAAMAIWRVIAGVSGASMN